MKNYRVPQRKRRRTPWLWILTIGGLALGAGVVFAVMVFVRVDSGEWRVPERDDFVRIARRFDNRPSKTIYLERHSIELRPGDDDAASGTSSVLSHAANKPVRTRGWSGGDAKWKSLVACTKKMFAPFDVHVTDVRPRDNDFLMVVVGGKSADIGVTDSHHVSGLAPFNGNVIPRAVVFAFSLSVNNDVRATCETLAMEVAHAYGLDHEYHCKDVMTYLRGCGTKSFVDADVPCGEGKQRACEGGASTQNSFRRLVGVLGARSG